MPRLHVRPVPAVALSPNKCAASIGIRAEKIAVAIRNGELPVYRNGTKTRILVADLERWIRDTWPRENINGGLPHA